MSGFSKHPSFKAFQSAASILIDQYMAKESALNLRQLRETIRVSKEFPDEVEVEAHS